MSPRPLVGLSLMVQKDFARASLPLFLSGNVDVVEWSFDTCWNTQGPPRWIEDLLNFYGRKNRLLGHGVYFSILSGAWTPRHQKWIDRLGTEVSRHRYRVLSEHFGFMSAGPFQQNAPLPTPRTDTLVNAARERMVLLKETAGIDVGLENLAFSFHADEARGQGDFMEELLDPVNGFLLLDLHNLYCQIHNFGLDPDAALATYPLHRVREIHISGGSWAASGLSQDRKIRRDTHDGPVPPSVFKLLQKALPLCPNLQWVILERLGGTLASPAQQSRWRKDFHQIKKIISPHEK